MQQYPNITKNNYRNIYDLVGTETETLRKAEDALQEESEKLKAASELHRGLVGAERVVPDEFIADLYEDHNRAERKTKPEGAIDRAAPLSARH